MFKPPLLALLLSATASAFALPFHSQHALVYEEETGKILLEKDAHSIVSIASLTKIMTAMVILDAHQDMQETINIDESDVDTVKHSSSRVPVGTSLPRHVVLSLALMSSDNRAASALARTYPGGRIAFLAAMQKKLKALKMHQTVIEEPTGLSPQNRSTATDLGRMAVAASHYPEITRLSTDAAESIEMNGQSVHFRNTNRLVGKKEWDIQLSKTGFTREAGRCLVMRMTAAGKNIIVVLLNARDGFARLADAENILRYLEGRPAALLTATVARTKRKLRSAAVSAKRHYKGRRR